jgi:hypothetical protein
MVERWNSHFFCFYVKLVLQEALENLLDVEHVFLGGAGEDQDVIEVDEDEPVHHVEEQHEPESGTQHACW